MKKKPTKRSKVKYPGLDKTVNLKIRQELFDQDYIDKLSDKEKQWLSNFNEEYISSNFNHPGRKLHKSKKSKRDCYNRNNARNRDIYSIAKTNDMLKDDKSTQAIIEDQSVVNPEDTENFLVDMIDFKKNQVS